MNPSNSIPTSSLPTMGTPQPQNQDFQSGSEISDEIDLVDIIVFFWKWRLLIIMSVMSGTIFGAALAFFKSQRPQSLPVNGLWNVTLGLGASDLGAPDQIMMALKSRQATLIFNPSAKESPPQPISSTLSSWHAKLLASTPATTPPVLDLSRSSALFSIEAPNDTDGSLLSKSLLTTANQAIDRYNQEVAVPFQKLESDHDAAVFSLAKITFDVIRLFESKSTSPSVINLEILKALVSSAPDPISKSGIYFLLAGVPDSISEKHTLFMDYQKHEALTAKGQKLREEYLKSYPPHGPLLAGKFDQTLSQTFLDSVVKTPAPNPSLYLIMGGFLGGGFAIFFAIAWQFARANKARIRQGLI